MSGFFHSSKLVTTKSTVPRIALCGSCSLHKGCVTPKMEPQGEGRKKILLVGEAPSSIQDKKGKLFAGKSSLRLKEMLRQAGVNLKKDCWKTNAVICHSPNADKLDSDKINACSCNLFKTIKKLDPTVVILLGRVAVQSMIGTLLQEETSSIAQWIGYQIPNHNPNVWICPTYHPSYLERMKDPVLDKLTARHLHEAVSKAVSKPYQKIPSFKKEIEIVSRPYEAAKILKAQLKKTKEIAFDYETNCLKPEYPKSEIVSASVCFDGNYTIAFPFSGEAIEPFLDLLRHPCGKIAANMKFEDRWTRYKFKMKVKNWVWDTMQAAHVLSNKTQTGLKFQSYVLLGQRSYNKHIEPFLESAGKNHLNRIHEIDLMDLLLYNGLDSLLEAKIADIQRERI